MSDPANERASRAGRLGEAPRGQASRPRVQGEALALPLRPARGRAWVRRGGRFLLHSSPGLRSELLASRPGAGGESGRGSCEGEQASHCLLWKTVTRRLRAGSRAAPRWAMDGRSPRADDASSVPTPLAAPPGRKPKARAPLPPSETKCMDVSSADGSAEPTMEQNENRTDKDIELSVVLPGDIVKSTTVHGSKPMMDLLIFLCAQYHLNPSSYTIDLLSADQNHIKFKPNTPIGILEVEKVILKPKNLDKKKPTPLIPEKTVRVVINFKKTQKTIVRVGPHTPLQELLPIICDKCEFDPLHTLLLKDHQSQEPLDLMKSLNDLGLRELYAMDVSRATSVSAFSKSSLQESCQIPQNLDIMKEKESKGFFSFFQRSKKKREQTASAPATPLINKHRPSFTRSNTLSKPYVSNTLPSDAPKKRRAPLPPMSASQSAPQDLAHIQERPASCVMKSTSVDETEKSPGEASIVRTGSLQLSHTSTGNSSLKRTKRKAPSPPSKIPLHHNDEDGHVTAHKSVDGVPPDGAFEANSPEPLNSPGAISTESPLAETSIGPGLLSHDQCTLPKLTDETSLSEGPETPEGAVASLTSGISSDYSLEEIDEKEELNEVPEEQIENTSLKSLSVPLSSTTTVNALKNDPNSAFGISSGQASPNFKKKNQETRNTDEKGQHNAVHDKSNEDLVAGHSPNPESEDLMTSRVKRTEVNVEGEAKNIGMDIEVNNALSSKENHLATTSIREQALSQAVVEKTKMQDVAIQTASSCNNLDGSHQDHNLSEVKVDESVQTSNTKSTQHSFSSLQDSLDTSKGCRSQSTLTCSEDRLARKNPMCMYSRDNLLSPTDADDKHSTASHPKNSPLYRPDYNPKPKPSNEITREYIPKIGMTTYKIVPPKSLDILKDWESETIEYKDDQKMHAFGPKPTYENVKETSMQRENLVASEGSKEPPLDLKPQSNVRTEHLLHRAMSSPEDTITSPLKPPRITTVIHTAAFAPNLEDINNILESKFKSRVSNPQAKPSSFFLQMQKRASGHYVTSAAAKSVHSVPTPPPSIKELTSKEIERDVPPPTEPMLSPLNKIIPSAPGPHFTKAGDDVISQKPAGPSPPPTAPKPMQLPVETSPPPISPKPVSLPTGQAASLNLKTLKTFGAPRPYSSSAPSPFALAVVKRSQSFSKTRSETSREKMSAKSPTDIEDRKTFFVTKSADIPQPEGIDKQNNSTYSEPSSQVSTPADCPSFTLKRQSSLTFQSSDPEQIRQSLLTAIRSGEAAAKLKRVTIPSNTVSVNGRSRLSRSLSSDAQESP
ncbi:cordon-bleu protein-like 1 isoform X3 [Perognathus longimembris pacificus]|uniref:cordon-bleu protein-like 1 isoform X3 n=1 Tax=Perognathus longimembris pacificus TaxID=214514 RepID=UPI00201A033D|nr:cordon-bleu protein-like 1 isoform X3 [Perognathus longimembris pacificus]